MPKSHTNRGALLTSNLPQLQNLIKRDPKAYREEFLQQWTHYQSILRIFQLNPTEHAQHFRELTSFISQVTNHSYSLRIGFCCRLAPNLVFLFHKKLHFPDRKILSVCKVVYTISTICYAVSLDAIVALSTLETQHCLKRTLLTKCISSVTDPISLYRSFNVIRKKQPSFPTTWLPC